MKLNEQKIASLKLVWHGASLSPAAYHGTCRAVFLQEGVSWTEAEEADCLVSLSGITTIECNPDVLEAVGSSFALTSTGVVQVSKEMLEEGETTAGSRVVLSKQVESFLNVIAAGDFQGTVVLFPEDKEPTAFVVLVVVPVTREEWMEAYNLKRLELTAATRLFNKVHGVEVTPEDVAFDRSLN